MSTDDRDSESSNPSNSFKLGEFDRLSGFFTPVWESKRKLRAESPLVTSKVPASKPSPSKPASSAGAREARDGERAERDDAASTLSLGKAPGAPGVRRDSDRPRDAAALVAPPSSELAEPGSLHGPALASPAAVAAVFNSAAAQIALEDSVVARGEAARADAMRGTDSPPILRTRSLIPLPPGASPRSLTPSPAAVAFKNAGPELPPQAFLDPEPDFRSPPRATWTDRSALSERSQRAAIAAARVHEQLKAKLQAEAAELAEGRYDLDPETDRTPLDTAALSSDNEPYPLSTLRHLRRTIPLSTPVSEEIRAMIAKHDRG